MTDEADIRRALMLLDSGEHDAVEIHEGRSSGLSALERILSRLHAQEAVVAAAREYLDVNRKMFMQARVTLRSALSALDDLEGKPPS